MLLVDLYSSFIMFPQLLNAEITAEIVAHGAQADYHHARLQLSEGLEQVDQLRKYVVEESEDSYLVTYRNGFNAGKPSIYAVVDKETSEVEYK